MKFCSACGTSLTEQSRFCSSCGSAVSEVLDQQDAEDLDQEDALESVPTYKVFTKRYVAVLALVGLVAIGGVAFARGGGSGDTYEECMAKPETTYQDCQGLPHGKSNTQADTDSDSGYSDSGYSDSEGYSEQPKTCLEWKTNYNHIGSDRVPTGQTCVRTG